MSRQFPIAGNPGLHRTALVLLLTACADGTTLMTAPADARATKAAASIVSVSGSWNWTSVEQLTLPAFVAEIFGIPVEGPITHVRCESVGTLELTQDGTSFAGSGERTEVTCETRGGFAFVPPPDFSPPVFSVEEGRIRGASVHFLTGGPLPSPHHGVISAAENGVAEALTATARTIVPGHPRSPLPLEPPPAGTSKTITWAAVRA